MSLTLYAWAIPSEIAVFKENTQMATIASQNAFFSPSVASK